MKPMLERMIDMVVASLSGEAREFYDREFGFFNEITSISGKLKPYVGKTKPEKKVSVLIHQPTPELTLLSYRLRLMKKWLKLKLKLGFTCLAIPMEK